MCLPSRPRAGPGGRPYPTRQQPSSCRPSRRPNPRSGKGSASRPEAELPMEPPMSADHSAAVLPAPRCVRRADPDPGAGHPGPSSDPAVLADRPRPARGGLLPPPVRRRPLAERRLPLWAFLTVSHRSSRASCWLRALLVLASAGLSARARPLRLFAVLVLAMVLIRPGLIVNALFKDHGPASASPGGRRWGNKPLRAATHAGAVRRRQAVPLRSQLRGFSLGVFYLIGRRRRPGWPGRPDRLRGPGPCWRRTHGRRGPFLLRRGLVRVIAYGVALALYFGTFRMPRREARATLASPGPRAPTGSRVLAVCLRTPGVGADRRGPLATPVDDGAREIIHGGSFDPSRGSCASRRTISTSCCAQPMDPSLARSASRLGASACPPPGSITNSPCGRASRPIESTIRGSLRSATLGSSWVCPSGGGSGSRPRSERRHPGPGPRVRRDRARRPDRRGGRC